MFYWF
jgi:hypothetical protein